MEGLKDWAKSLLVQFHVSQYQDLLLAQLIKVLLYKDDKVEKKFALLFLSQQLFPNT